MEEPMPREVATDPRQEEREARAHQRRLAKLQQGAQKKREAEERSRRAEIIREELAKPRARACRCGITPRTTPAQLLALGSGCTAGRWVCPVLDAIRRRLGR
jgi:hypothetical protein